MPLTDDEITKIATATALATQGYRNKEADERSVAETGKRIPDSYAYLTRTHDSVQALLSQLAAQTAAIQSLAAQLGEDVDTAAVVAAVQQAIADAVIRVDIDVNGQDTP